MKDREITTTIDATVNNSEQIAAGRLQLDHSRLRLLDAAFWTYAKSSS